MGRAAVFVSVTTLPSRIGRLRPTLDSLRAQTLPPDRILVCLPPRSVREGAAYALPPWLDPPPPGVEVVRSEQDHGPGTKLLGCLPRVPPDACLIVVDDDMVYKPFLVERLYRAQLARRDAPFSFCVWRIGRFRCGQGADGFSFWTPNLDGIEAFAAAALKSRDLFLVDDYWISVFLRSRGIPVLSLEHTLGEGELVWAPSHADTQLSRLGGALRRSAVLRKGTWFLVTRGVLAPRWRLACLLTYVEGGLRSLWLRMPGLAARRRRRG
jgi:hypothetical protein